MSKHGGSVMRQPTSRRLRKGNMLVLTAMMMVVMCCFVAFAVDLGYLYTVKTELQAAADSASLAAAGAMYEAPTALETNTYSAPPDPYEVRHVAADYVKLNGAPGLYMDGDYTTPVLQVEHNHANDIDGDIVVGQLYDPSDQSSSLIPTETTPNSVLVRIHMQDGQANEPASLFFAPIMGIFEADVSVTAIATVDYPTLLPFATSDTKWNSLNTGGDGDNWDYDPGNITSGPDGVSEIQIFPDNNWNGNGMPPGNFGALEIGGMAGTDILRSQIDLGPSASDLAYHGGTLTAGMVIPGKTGVNGDIKSAFNGGNADERVYAGILGKTRYIPLYSDVTGNGSNSQFTINKFVAVRVMAVQMTGNPKSIVLQPVTEINDLLGLRITR